MSAHIASDDSDRTPAPGGRASRVTKAVAAVAAAGALAFGAHAVTDSDASSSTAGGNTPAMAGARTGTPPDMGTAVTGSTLTKLTSVATARYPGTVERAMQGSDGSYVVHVVQSNGDGEVHVLVSKSFQVTGLEQGGPAGGAPPAGQTAPGAAGAATDS